MWELEQANRNFEILFFFVPDYQRERYLYKSKLPSYHHYNMRHVQSTTPCQVSKVGAIYTKACVYDDGSSSVFSMERYRKEGQKKGGRDKRIYNQAKTAKTPTSKPAVLFSSLPRLSAAAPVADGSAAPDPEAVPFAPEVGVCFAPEAAAVGLLS